MSVFAIRLLPTLAEWSELYKNSVSCVGSLGEFLSLSLRFAVSLSLADIVAVYNTVKPA